MQLQSEQWTQVSVGGILAILVLREVFGFLRTRNGARSANSSSGNRPVEYWQVDMRKALAEAFQTSILPALSNQTDLLREIRDEQKETHKAIYDLAAVCPLSKDRKESSR